MTKFIESNVGGVEKTARNIFRTRLISQGQGSSGFYSAEVLKRDVPKAMPKGTKVYFDHMSREEMESGRARAMDKLVGVFESEPYFVESEQASFADIRIYENSPIFKNVPEFIAEALNDIGVSIEVHAGKKDDNDLVEELSFSPHNSLAIVTAGGARGKIDSLIESFRSAENQETETDKVRINNMERAELLEALKESNDTFAATLIEALTKVLKPAVEDEPVKVSLETISEAIATAGLTKEGRQAVYASVEQGVAVESAVQVEKDRETAIIESLKTKMGSEGGFLVQESSTSKNFNEQYEAGIK